MRSGAWWLRAHRAYCSRKDECARADRNYRAPLAADKFQNLRIFSGVRSRAEPAGHNKQIKSWRFLQDAIRHNLQPVAAADIWVRAAWEKCIGRGTRGWTEM